MSEMGFVVYPSLGQLLGSCYVPSDVAINIPKILRFWVSVDVYHLGKFFLKCFRSER